MTKIKGITAVIPARAGSKGIPNKNIRLIKGKPLIYYVIQNALMSQYITDIIVTTDSPEVEIISKQMGVRVIKRSPLLSSDDVTLDSVVFDTVEDIETEYVITMQPTSPTLKVETLDRAIEYFFCENLDTLISGINSPHLSWKVEGNNKKPNYSERLNRQYLPAHFLETGAFLITKKSAITSTSRIGPNVDIFETTRDEAIDIDTFGDLKYAEEIINKKKVAMYVNGNNKRGMGHVYRALELADEFYSKPDIFYDINQTDVRIFGETTHNLIGLDGIEVLFNNLRKGNYDIVINDILNTSVDYMIALKRALPDAKIINFEDDGEGATRADLVINALYQEESSRIKSGEKYYISAKTFMFYEPVVIREKVRKVFISFGGADPQNYTDRLLEIIIKDKYKDYEFVVVLGRAKLNIKEILEYNNYPNIEVFYDIRNMPEVMSECDIGITSRGRTGYELALLGIPSIAVAQNKREEKHGFVCKENGFNYLGLNPPDHVIEETLDMYLALSEKQRLDLNQILLSHELRNGRNRVMNLINGL